MPENRHLHELGLGQTLLQLLLHLLLHLNLCLSDLFCDEVVGRGLELSDDFALEFFTLLNLRHRDFVLRLNELQLLLQALFSVHLLLDAILRCLQLQLDLFFFGHSTELEMTSLSVAEQMLRDRGLVERIGHDILL